MDAVAPSESGLPIQPVYDRWTLSDFATAAELGAPSRFPFARNLPPPMYTGRPLTMRQYIGVGTAKESAKRCHESVGTSDLSVAFSLPTQMGNDADKAIAQGEVGKAGVTIDSIEDMRTLLQCLPLGAVSTVTTINEPM